MKVRSFLPLLCLCVALCGCRHSETVTRPVTPFVQELLSDASLPGRVLLSEYDAADAGGALFIVGEKEACSQISDALERCDAFDNVDGRRSSDGLPDFAGETLCSVYDCVNVPYAGYADAGNADFLRELTVKSVLDALDTLCYVSPYDRSGMGLKPRAKAVVLASSQMALYGLFDLDTLLRSAACELPVISTLDAMLDQAFAPARKPTMVGVLGSRSDISSGIYSTLLRQKARKNGVPACECVAFASASEPDPLQAFVDSYLAAGYDRPLDVLLVDDLSVDMTALRERLERMRSVMDEESMTYGKVFPADFRVIDVRTAVIDACFRTLRTRNLFTHGISFPATRLFILCPRPELGEQYYGADGYFTDAFKFGRAPGSSAATTMLLQYSSRFLPKTADTDVQD